MPVFSRKTLRQALGQSYLNDLIVSATTLTANFGVTGYGFQRSQFADLSMVGQNLYENATIRHLATGGASGQGYDYRVSSFNAASGAWFTSQITMATVNFNDTFEIHSRVSPAEKDLAIDDAIKKIRVKQEIGIMTGTAGTDFYSIENVAAPHYVSKVLDAYYFAAPAGSLFRDRREFDDIKIVNTGSGREIRFSPALSGSQQIVLDAILELTLGPNDAATVNIPDDRWVLASAAAKSYDLLIMQAPGQAAGALAARRAEWAGEFTRLSSRFAPDYSSKIRLEDPLE